MLTVCNLNSIEIGTWQILATVLLWFSAYTISLKADIDLSHYVLELWYKKNISVIYDIWVKYLYIHIVMDV